MIIGGEKMKLEDFPMLKNVTALEIFTGLDI